MNKDDTYLNLSEMTNLIKSFLERNGFIYKTIHNCNDIQILYQLIKNEDRNRVSKLTSNVKYISGLYFELINDIKSMMEQYLEGVELGCSECMNLLGRYYYRNKDYHQMMKLWEMAINKKNKESNFNLSKYIEDEKQYDKMIHALQMAIELGSEKAILSLANYYQKNKEFEKMIEIYRKGAHNGYTSCMCELGNYYIRLGDTQNAMKYYMLASDTNPEAMYRLGIIYESKKEYSKMVEYYSQALHRDHIDSMIRLGDYYKKIKNYDLMIYIYKMAARKNPDVMNKLGLYYQKKKQFPEMMKYYESAIKLGCVNAMNNLAIYYESVGEYEKMKTLLEKAIEKKSSVAMYNMGLYYEKMKDYDKMGEYFMMSYQNGRVFDYSEIKLMKKSILQVRQPKLIDDLKKMVSDKKKQFKEIFSFKKTKENQVNPKLSGPHSGKDKHLRKETTVVRQKSLYKFSKGESHKANGEKKIQNLIEIPVEENPKKSLFNDMELYKIIGNIDQPTTSKKQPVSNLDWIMDLDPCHQVTTEAQNTTQNTTQSTTQNKAQSTTGVLEVNSGSGSSELNMYRMFVGLHK